MAKQLLIAGRIHAIINIWEFIELPGEEVEYLLKDFIKYIIELYIGPNCNTEIDKKVIKQR
jgi:hypothetical protein